MPNDVHLPTSKASPVGPYSIQFYLPVPASKSPHCLFDAEDPAEIRVLPNAGILITPKGMTPTIADIVADLSPKKITASAPLESIPIGPGAVTLDETIPKETNP